MKVIAGAESVGNSVFYINRGAWGSVNGLLNCFSSQRLLSRFIAEAFFKCCQIMVDLGQAVGPVAAPNGNIAIADICAVDFIGPFGHVGPGVATFPIGGKRLRGCYRIARLLVNGIEESCAEEIGIVEAKGVDDKDVLFNLAKLRRLRSRAATKVCGCERFSR